MLRSLVVFSIRPQYKAAVELVVREHGGLAEGTVVNSSPIMVILRCSQSLLKRIKGPVENDTSTGRLGDWYARALFLKPRQLVLCTNEASLLSVVVPLAPLSSLQGRFVAAASSRVRQIPAPANLLAEECAALEDVRIGKAINRSVISTMNQLVYYLEERLFAGRSGDLEELGLFLCDTPFTAISKTWPLFQAEFVLTGAVAREGTAWRVQSNVL